MEEKKSLPINIAIFPKAFEVRLGKSIPKEEMNNHTFKPENAEIYAELPRQANILYIQHILTEANSEEYRLLEQYAYGVKFNDEDFQKLIGMIFVPNRQTLGGFPNEDNDIFGLNGIAFSRNEEGKSYLNLIPECIPQIKADTWDYIMIDMMHKQAFEIIECFDFKSEYYREESETKEDFKLSLGAWSVSGDKELQSLSNALRSAFMFTLAGFHWGDKKDQYDNFPEYFDAEFYKRAALIFESWKRRKKNEQIKYIAIYDSFFNLQSNTKEELIDILKVVLDSDEVTFDDKEVLRTRLIEGAMQLHNNTDAPAIALEENLIKPVVNYVLLREKSKEALETAKLLLQNKKYYDCANRCYYAMMDALKALLENRNLLAGWKRNELKETESHNSLEVALKDLVSQGIITQAYESDYQFVLSQRMKCDYSQYMFNKNDAQTCVNKAESFYKEMERLLL